MKKFISTAVSIILIATASVAQNFSQTIRGRVIDHQSDAPLPGVNIILLDMDPVIGTSSDIDGYYAIENVPIGRVSLQATFVGYEPVTLNNLELTSGKELVLNFEMEEQIIEMDEVVIKASSEKTETNNEMTTVSARQFTIEESQRYAGARNDVSRMAQNFAGVRGANDAVNDIVIRGNSPVGLLWRLEGIDIPNPNHFGDFGSTGGPVSMLNNNVLANSDFLTGAFPAEYGNGISGVFDLKMRNGNIDKHEFLGQIGLNGLEAGAEGPLNKNNRSSYLINYRYSTLGIMSALGINFGTGTAIPYYQDLTFKFNFPTGTKGSFSVFGLGGFSSIDLISSGDQNAESNLYIDYVDVYNRVKTGVAGISHTYLIDNTSYTKLTLAVSSITNNNIVDSVSYETFEAFDFYREHFELNKISGVFYYKKKFNPKNTLEAGIRADDLLVNVADSILRIDQYEILTEFDGSTYLIQPYAEWQHKFNDKLTLNAGLHYQILTLNNSDQLEPRAGLKYKISERDMISIGYGLHSMTTPLAIYFQTAYTPSGALYQPNTNLDLVKAHHLIFGYDHIFNETVRAKAEIYYQRLFDVVTDRDSSSYSGLNTGTFSLGLPDSMANTGTGENYGMELTVEKFLDNGFYFLITGSLYKSIYVGSDGIERSTAFDGNYVGNILAGKEFMLQSKKETVKFKKSLVVDGRFTAAGGQRYTPVDLTASIAAGEAVYQSENAYSEQFSDYMRLDLRAAFKLNGKNASQEWAIDVQNVTNRENPFSERYNPVMHEVVTINQLGIFPVMQYRITF